MQVAQMMLMAAVFCGHISGQNLLRCRQFLHLRRDDVTYSLQLGDGLRPGLLVVPGTLLRCLGSLSSAVSKPSDGLPRSAIWAFRLPERRELGGDREGRTGKGIARGTTGGHTLPPPIVMRLLGSLLLLVWFLAIADVTGRKSLF